MDTSRERLLSVLRADHGGPEETLAALAEAGFSVVPRIPSAALTEAVTERLQSAFPVRLDQFYGAAIEIADMTQDRRH